MSKQKVIVLAFDIERSGGRACDDTMAIGVSVVDEETYNSNANKQH